MRRRSRYSATLRKSKKTLTERRHLSAPPRRRRTLLVHLLAGGHQPLIGLRLDVADAAHRLTSDTRTPHRALCTKRRGSRRPGGGVREDPTLTATITAQAATRPHTWCPAVRPRRAAPDTVTDERRCGQVESTRRNHTTRSCEYIASFAGRRYRGSYARRPRLCPPVTRVGAAPRPH